MHENLNPPFNLLGWSLAILISFMILQITITVAYGMWGFSVSPFVALFTWFAVSGALAFSIYSRYRPQLTHFFVLQGISCFYVLAISIAITLRSGAGFSPMLVQKGLAVFVSLYAVGVIGSWLAANYYQWRRS